MERLGTYIEQVYRTNADLRYGLDDVRGVSNTKEMMQSRANLIGRTFEKFSVISPGDFVFNRRTTRNGEKIGMAFNNTDRDYIFTEDYVAFKVKDECKTVLLPEYLYLFFRRSEFDRYARYMSTGSATEFFNWEDMCNVPFTPPTMEFQQKMVRAMATLEQRIAILQQINDNLFESARIHMLCLNQHECYFDQLTTLDEYCVSLVSGGTPSRTSNEYWDNAEIPWLKNGEIKNNIILTTEESISQEGLKNSAAKLVPTYTVNMAMYCVSEIQVSLSCIPLSTNQAVLNLTTDSFRKACYVYYLLAAFGNNLTSQANGSAQQNLSKEKIASYSFLAPKLSDSVFDFFEVSMQKRIQLTKEIAKLEELKAIMLSRLRG